MARQYIVSSRIEAKDDASRPIRRVEGSFARLGNFLKSRLVFTLGDVTRAFRGVFRAVSAVFEAAQKQELAVKQLEGVLKSMGRTAELSASGLIATAGALQKVTVFGDEAIIKVQALLATFGNLSAELFDRTTKVVLDLSRLLDQDLKSSAVQLGKALDDPIKGISALSRVGVSFSEKQKETIRTLVETNRALEAQALILDALEKQVGGASEIKTLGDRFERLKNTLGDVFESVGQTSDKVGGLSARVDGLTESIEKAEPGIRRFLEFFGAVTGEILGGFADKVRTIGDVWGRVAALIEDRFRDQVEPSLAALERTAAAAGISVEELRRRLDQAGSTIGNVTLSTEDLAVAADAAATAEERLAKAQLARRKAEEALVAATELTVKQLRDLGVTLEADVAASLEKNKELLDAARAAAERGAITWRDYEAAVTAVAEADAELKGELADTAVELVNVSEAGTAAATSLDLTAQASVGALRATVDLRAASEGAELVLRRVGDQAVATARQFDVLAASGDRAAAVNGALAAGGELILGGTRIRLAGGGSRLTRPPGITGLAGSTIRSTYVPGRGIVFV